MKERTTRIPVGKDRYIARDPDGHWAEFSVIGYERRLSDAEAKIADAFAARPAWMMEMNAIAWKAVCQALNKATGGPEWIDGLNDSTSVRCATDKIEELANALRATADHYLRAMSGHSIPVRVSRAVLDRAWAALGQTDAEIAEKLIEKANRRRAWLYGAGILAASFVGAAAGAGVFR